MILILTNGNWLLQYHIFHTLFRMKIEQPTIPQETQSQFHIADIFQILVTTMIDLHHLFTSDNKENRFLESENPRSDL